MISKTIGLYYITLKSTHLISLWLYSKKKKKLCEKDEAFFEVIETISYVLLKNSFGNLFENRNKSNYFFW